MSILAVFLVLIQLVTNGFKHEIDEGALAHLWQLLIVIQMPLIVFFAFRWLGRARQKL